MKQIFFVLFLYFIAINAMCQLDIQHPIEQRLDSCLIESNYTTYGVIGCLEESISLWQSEIEKYYELLLDTLPDELKPYLIESQNQWIEYKENETIFVESFYDAKAGTMWQISKMDAKMLLYQKRAMNLGLYYSDYIIE